MAELEFTAEELQSEEWRAIRDFPDYDVSSLGRVRRATPGLHTFIGRLVRPRLKKGYWTVCISALVSGRRKQHTRNIHRLVAVAFLGSPPFAGAQVNHKNGIKTNNRVANLEWCSPAGNTAHATLILGVNCGERSVNAKFTEQDILAIYDALRRGVSPTELSRQFRIPVTRVHAIKRKKTWRHALKDAPTDFAPVIRKGQKADKNPGAKLTAMQVKAIRRRLSAGEPQVAIARAFSVSAATICMIKQGKSWPDSDIDAQLSQKPVQAD